jgi:hypothetical protein
MLETRGINLGVSTSERTGIDGRSKEHGDLTAGLALGSEIVRRSGDLVIVDIYYAGNLPIGRPHPREQTLLKLRDETIVRRLAPPDAFPAPTAFVLTLPQDALVDITMIGPDNKASTIADDSVNFLYIPRGLQVYGKIGKAEFVSLDGKRLHYSEDSKYGRVVWGVNNTMGMMGQFEPIYVDGETPYSEMGRTGIGVNYWQ